MVYSIELGWINAAMTELKKRVIEGERGEHLADAIDHLGAAREALGGGSSEDETDRD